jgi:hypothetical protein
MKTIYRTMFEVLTPEEYKNFCKNVNPQRVGRLHHLCSENYPTRPKIILLGAFNWENSKQGYHYWENVAERLRKI